MGRGRRRTGRRKPASGRQATSERQTANWKAGWAERKVIDGRKVMGRRKVVGGRKKRLGSVDGRGLYIWSARRRDFASGGVMS